MVVTFAVCIAVRTLIAALAGRHDSPVFRQCAWAIAFSFALLYATGIRKTGLEVNNGKGGTIWWNALRPLHALMWGAFAATGNATWLFLDVVVGMLAKESRI